MPRNSEVVDVLDDRDVQGESLFVVKGEQRFELWAWQPSRLIAVAKTIRALSRFAHGEHCKEVVIDSAIEDD